MIGMLLYPSILVLIAIKWNEFHFIFFSFCQNMFCESNHLETLLAFVRSIVKSTDPAEILSQNKVADSSACFSLIALID